MRRIVWLAAAAGLAYAAWKQANDIRAGRELWAEVTDPVE